MDYKRAFYQIKGWLVYYALDCQPTWVGGSSPTMQCHRYLFLHRALPRSLLSSTPKSEEVTVTASFGGDVKPSVPGDLAFISLRLFAGPR